MALAVGVVNFVLAGALVGLSLGSLRRSFGRATGLWHPCLPGSSGHGAERWSPLLLAVVAVPVIVGVLVAATGSPGRLRGLAVAGTAVLVVVALALVAIPTATCVT
ncbi:MAG: hypothetical protein M3Q23_05565 [Actinomycetota bacterium]|nr:hypothetical protein [Actinomycetota bacterium]